MHIDSTCPNQKACEQPASGNCGRDPQKVLRAAQQFEALLIGQMLKTVRESSGSDGWMGTGDGADGTMMDYAEQSLATVLASQGGLGLAQLVTDGLTKANDTAGCAAEGDVKKTGRQTAVRD